MLRHLYRWVSEEIKICLALKNRPPVVITHGVDPEMFLQTYEARIPRQKRHFMPRSDNPTQDLIAVWTKYQYYHTGMYVDYGEYKQAYQDYIRRLECISPDEFATVVLQLSVNHFYIDLWADIVKRYQENQSLFSAAGLIHS